MELPVQIPTRSPFDESMEQETPHGGVDLIGRETERCDARIRWVWLGIGAGG
jgi:hypothetical protein